MASQKVEKSSTWIPASHQKTARVSSPPIAIQTQPISEPMVEGNPEEALPSYTPLPENWAETHPLMHAGENRTTPNLQKQDEPATEIRGGQTYTVVSGDSLWKIARETYGDPLLWRDLARGNPENVARGGDLILVGAVLYLPPLEVPIQSVATTPAIPTGGTGEAIEPLGMSTEFGSFEIYPDDFPGSLPQSVRTEATWPIRQSDYDQLIARLTEVRNGTSQLSVVGTDDFVAATYLDLGWLMTSGVGQELIAEIQAAPHTVTINESTGGNTTSYNPDADSYERPVSPPTPGAGANVTIGYNPYRLQVGDASQAWMTRPPAIGLAHEMVHAWTGVYGTRALGESGGVRRREQQATGLGEYGRVRISENRFRAAFGLPQRPEY